MTMKSDEVWIFAYGSLCWRPGFEYEEMVLGHIKGYKRRFWQGNVVHRGTVKNPGRVATLISDNHGEVQGCAFKISEANSQKTLKYLENRETNLGGYDCRISTFYPCEPVLKPVKAIFYIALPGNEDWRGPGKLNDIADEVVTARGVCGTNVNYVLDLANFLRINNFKDDHLFELEVILLEKLKILEESSSESSSEFASESSSSSSTEEFDTDSSI